MGFHREIHSVFHKKFTFEPNVSTELEGVWLMKREAETVQLAIIVTGGEIKVAFWCPVIKCPQIWSGRSC